MPIEYRQLERMVGRQAKRFPVPPICTHCDYELTGLTVPRCPECGQPFKIDKIRMQSVQNGSLIRRLAYANSAAWLGLKLAAGAWAAVLLFQLPLLRNVRLAVYLAATAGAVLATVLGLSVFQLYRVPRGARRFIEKPPPRILLGVATLALSFLTLLTAFLAGL